jgi:cell division septation protein DedD
VPEPRTHYQVSFTSRQAVLLFVVVLAALTGAYFLGVATGLAGRQPAESAAVSASPPVPTASAAAETASGGHAPSTLPAISPAAEQERTAPPVAVAREPGRPEGLQFFEDRPAEPTPAARTPSGHQAPAPAKAAGSFWVQVLSTTSEREAKSRRVLLSGHGYRSIVEPTHSLKGPVLYRVRVGPYASREAAAKAAEVLERREKAKTWIVKPGE